MMGSQKGRDKCVKLLLDRGAEINHKNKVSTMSQLHIECAQL